MKSLITLTEKCLKMLFKSGRLPFIKNDISVHHMYFTGQAGIPVATLLNYGPIDQGMAWLSRRVTENRSGLGTADKERTLAQRELIRRLKSGQLTHTKVWFLDQLTVSSLNVFIVFDIFGSNTTAMTTTLCPSAISHMSAF